MSALTYRRKLGEVWVFDDLYVQDRAGNRQSIFGLVLTATCRAFDGVVIWSNDTTGVTVDEVQADATTTGNFTYRRADLTGIVAGATYRIDFRATINGELVAIPEDTYLVLEVI